MNERIDEAKMGSRPETGTARDATAVTKTESEADSVTAEVSDIGKKSGNTSTSFVFELKAAMFGIGATNVGQLKGTRRLEKRRGS